MQFLKLCIAALVLSCFGLTQAQAQANAIDKYFSQYVNDDNFTVVYISPKMFQMLDKMNINGIKDADSKVLMEIAKDLRGLRILTTDVNPKKYHQEARAKINTNEYETLMTVRNKGGENVDFLVKEEPGSNGNILSELLLLAGGAEEFVLISFVGKISLDKVSKLAKSMEN